jgi:hypothetical protein
MLETQMLVQGYCLVLCTVDGRSLLVARYATSSTYVRSDSLIVAALSSAGLSTVSRITSIPHIKSCYCWLRCLLYLTPQLFFTSCALYSPSNAREIEAQSTLIINRIRTHASSSPTPLVGLMEQFYRGVEVVMHAATLIAALSDQLGGGLRYYS